MESWARLEQVINWSKLTVNAFALSIGLKRAENLYQIKKGRNAISKDLAELISKKYPGISKSWLITGEGQMFIDDNQDSKQAFPFSKIPYYGSVLKVAREGALNFSKPLYYMDVPVLANCDFAISWLDDSMAPEIPAGSIITLKETAISAFLPGEIYLIVTPDYITVKRLRAAENDEQGLRLVPANKAAYDETVIKKASVLRCFMVKGVISVKVP